MFYSYSAEIDFSRQNLTSTSKIDSRAVRVNPLTAGPEYILFFYIFYRQITYQVLNMTKIKPDIKQQDLKKVYLHSVKSE